MISTYCVKHYCCEDISKIENYEKAVNDKTQLWDCHHRLELIATGGVCDVTAQDLIDWGIYYNRPADELIFLTHGEHSSLHLKDKSKSAEIKRKLSEANKGKTLSEETKRKLSKACKGKHWKLVDGKRIYY